MAPGRGRGFGIDLLPRLSAAGLRCAAIDLPGNGAGARRRRYDFFEMLSDISKAVIDALPDPVSLVAHSGGGNVASAFAELRPDLVSRIVYVAGIMLPNGKSFVDIVAEAAATHPDAVGVDPATQYSRDGRVSYVPPDAAIGLSSMIAHPKMRGRPPNA